MLSLKVVKAVSLLKDIHYGLSVSESRREHGLSSTEVRMLLDKFLSFGLIRLKSGCKCGIKLSSYELCYPLNQISLCDIAVATGGGIELSSIEDSEEIYRSYGLAGRRLGVLNQMACRYLADIHLTDVFLSEQR